MAVFGRWGHKGPYKKGEVKIKYTKRLRIAEIIGIVMIFIIIAYTAFMYPVLPDTIPTHFGVTGEADAWGGKGHLWLVPFVAVIVYVLVTIAAFFPNSWNYPFKIDPEKLDEAENLIRNMLMHMKLLITALFGYMQWETIKLSADMSMGVTFVFFLIMFAIFLYYISKLRKISLSRKKMIDEALKKLEK